MEEILQSIKQAEEQAALIKSAALEKAAKIVADAEANATEIAKKSEADCRALREKCIKQAENAARDDYSKAIEKRTAECAAFADNVIEKSKGLSQEIVRRILRGSC